MISNTIKTLLIAAGMVVLSVYLAGCAATARETKIKKPPAKTTLLPRAFEGAPPFIPHEVEVDMECLECHRQGDNDAVITSHPERVNCIQCHIRQNMDVMPFIENTF